MIARVLLIVTLIVGMRVSVTRAGGFSLVPGDIYGVITGGIRQYDAGLNEVASKTFAGMGVTQGLGFTSSGHLVFSGYFQSDHYVLEIDENGTIVHVIDLNVGSLDRTAHMDIDPQGRIYAATSLGVVEIPADFGTYTYLEYDFGRASGVAVGADDKLYITDQSEGLLVVFGSDRAFERSFYIGFAPAGLDFAPDGRLLVCIFAGQELRLIDLDSDTSSVVLSGVVGPADITFVADGSYYLSTDGGDFIEHRTADHALITSIATGDFVDCILDMPVDEPPPACAGDANGDGIVDPLDAGFVQSRFGCSVGGGDSECDAADVNDDGVVDPLDVGYVLSRFGECQ